MTKRKEIQLLQDENTKLKAAYELLEKREKYYFLEYMRSKDQIKNAASIIASAGEANSGATDMINKLREENEQLNKKLAKQTQIARDANAKFTGVEHYLKPFQYKADRLKTKCDDLKKLSDWQREEIKRLKAELNKGCNNCETIKQGRVDVLRKAKRCCQESGTDYYPFFEKLIDNLIKEEEDDFNALKKWIDSEVQNDRPRE